MSQVYELVGGAPSRRAVDGSHLCSPGMQLDEHGCKQGQGGSAPSCRLLVNQAEARQHLPDRRCSLREAVIGSELMRSLP